MKNKHSFDFMDLLEEKGFLSSGKPDSTRETPQTLGRLFKDLLKELTTDPEIKEKTQKNYKIEETTSKTSTSSATDKRSAKSLESERKHASAEALRQEQAIRIRNEDIEKRREVIQRQREMQAQKQKHLDQEEAELAAKLQHNLTISTILSQRSTLKQAFILSEIIAKPLGLKE